MEFYGAEEGGNGTDSDRHAATLTTGDDEVFHGMRTQKIDEDVDKIANEYLADG